MLPIIKGEVYMKDIDDLLANLGDKEKRELCRVFLSRVYTSFFVFEHDSMSPDAKEVIETIIIEKKLWKSAVNSILNVSEFFPSDNIDIWEACLFPFIRIWYWLFDKEYDPSVNEILRKFHGIFYRYLCVMEIEGKIVVFTDISEDFFESSLKGLAEKWYQKVELHNIIPNIIDSLSKKFQTWEAEVDELWVSFPLSMLGPHANINNKSKHGNQMWNDVNFRNIVRYGLLNSVKINSDLDFSISFNSDNEKDKYRLPWYLSTIDGSINIDILLSLSNFLKEIDKSSNNPNESNFAWLPIYVISGKRSYKEGAHPLPIFSYSRGSQWGELRLILSRNELNQEHEEYIITGIYPQYLKKWDYRNYDIYCCLKKRDGREDPGYIFEEIKNVFWENNRIPCNTLLHKIKDEITKSYWYVNEESPKNANHPDFMLWDFFLTAVSSDSTDKSDYLINIVEPKRRNGQRERKISISKYKLSCFDFNMWSITKIIDQYNRRERDEERKIQTASLWTIEKEMLNDPNYKFNLNGEFLFDVKLKCKDAKSDASFHKLKKQQEKSKEDKKKQKKYGCPEKYKDKDYGNDSLWFEDLWSLCFMELLETCWYRAFFWGRTSWGNDRELADVISLKPCKNWINIDFYHMKLKPFEQKSTSVLEAAFSHYTEVVGQILEKAKAFLYTGRFEDIIEWLRQYFPGPDSRNYEIFEALESAIKENRGNYINFNFYFPVQEKDYFNYDQIDGNNLKRLWLETNWKRLKIISEVFNANISSVNPNMKVHLHLGLVICRWVYTGKDKHIKTKITLLHRIERLF